MTPSYRFSKIPSPNILAYAASHMFISDRYLKLSYAIQGGDRFTKSKFSVETLTGNRSPAPD